MKKNKAVLHLKNRDPQNVYYLGGRVNTCMVEAISTFTDSKPTMEEFGREVL
jgi:hypothetical protein